MRLILLAVVTSLIAIATPAQASQVALFAAKQQAQVAIGVFVKSKSEQDCAIKIAFKESRYQPNAKNLYSSARGIWQLTWGKAQWSVLQQASEANKYVRHRYGSWCNALAFHQERNYF
jgi:hypothetical protein